jgi:hypothetical protein
LIVGQLATIDFHVLASKYEFKDPFSTELLVSLYDSVSSQIQTASSVFTPTDCAAGGCQSVFIPLTETLIRLPGLNGAAKW